MCRGMIVTCSILAEGVVQRSDATAFSEMPPKGAKGLTKEQRDEAAAQMDKLIEEFVKEIKDVEKPDKKLFLGKFNKSQMEVLWTRIEAKRGKAPSTIKEAWDTLRSMGQAKASDKRHECLITFLKDLVAGKEGEDGAAWQEQLLTIADEFTKTRTQTVEKEKLTFGQLVVQHTKAEALAMIRKGKFEKTVDKWGDTVYVRTNKKDKVEKSRKQTLRTDRHIN